jgi:hypothetical protein
MKTTHIVSNGKLRINAYQDGNNLYAVHSSAVVATRAVHNGVPGWNRPVSPVKPPKYPPGQWDHIKSLGNQAITMTWDGIPQGRYF